MTIIALELTSELEQQLRDEPAKQGLDPKHYILNTLSWHLGSVQRRTNLLTQAETDLLQKINSISAQLKPQPQSLYRQLSGRNSL